MTKPVTVGVTYYGDAFDTVAGGLEPGWVYEGRLGLILDADLGQIFGWQGARLHASAHQIHGEPPTPGHIGALALVSGIEAEPNTRLFNLWIEQTAGRDASLRVGQFTAAQEFAISPTAGLFVNSTFGWPNILAQDLPSGGPAYPIGALGARLSFSRPHGTLLVAIFNGDPAGPGAGDPQRRDSNGLNSFGVSGGPFLIAEAQFRPPWTSFGLRIGAWWLDRKVPAQSLGTPAQPPDKRGDWGGYAILDSTIAKWGGLSLAGFVRGAVAPGDRNLIGCYVDGGLTLSGFRADDQLGFAAALSTISPASRRLDAEAVGQGALVVVRDYEGVFEATYQTRITSHWWFQPDAQLITHPGGHVPFPGEAPSRRAIPSALVVGVRNVVRF